jgi:phage FluMu protein Com
VIRLTCDNCEKVLEVPETAAGQKVKCPACGDVQIVPKTAKVPDADDRAKAAGYPAASGPEQRVMVVRQAMFRSRPFLFLILLVLLLGGGGVAVYYALVAKQMTYAWPGVGAAVLGLLGFITWVIWTHTTSLEITNKRTIERKGLFSRFTSEVRHQDIRNIQVTQSFFDRLMRVGRIGISSAGQDDVEIVADDIPSPDRLREVIDLYRVL